MPDTRTGFTVDTHLFRELGELLVGRDSTALVELIKNAYDADAKMIEIRGLHLDDPRVGVISLFDDGNGMTPDVFKRGFLRVASRLKEQGERRSPIFSRRFTGAKGVGRLAAHKLAERMTIVSIPRPEAYPHIKPGDLRGVTAEIDWAHVESLETLADVEESGAVTVSEESAVGQQHGTLIELRILRRPWTPTERARLNWQLSAFRPPAQLVAFPPRLLPKPDDPEPHEHDGSVEPIVFRDSRATSDEREDPGFTPKLTGEFDAGDAYPRAAAEAAHWLLDISCSHSEGETPQVQYRVIPTKLLVEKFPDARPAVFTTSHPNPADGPFFFARIMVKDPTARDKDWPKQAHGVRVYMEGFRVLPYGERGDDWLGLDQAYAVRTNQNPFLKALFPDLMNDPSVDKSTREGLSTLANRSIFGAVFLTMEGAPRLRMLVNREGFVPDASFDQLTDLVKGGFGVLLRHRSQVTRPRKRRQKVQKLKAKTANLAQDALEALQQARRALAERDVDGAAEALSQAFDYSAKLESVVEARMSEPETMRILASLGLQMAAFVHEIQGLLGMSRAIEKALERVRASEELSPDVRTRLARLNQSLGDLRRVVERQASYLVDVTTPDARRRRSRQRLSERLEAAARLVQSALLRREIELVNDIPADLKSPPMFPAEITLVFSNLLSNAIKAAGTGGRIRGWAPERHDGKLEIRLENSGVAVDLQHGDRWFRPFESTTDVKDINHELGQGMGMGLAITRNMLEEYGARITFVPPSEPAMSTAVQIVFS